MGRALGLVTLGYPLRRGKSAGAAAFSPSDLDNLALWLKADAGLFQSSGGSAASADGDPVGQWQDQSGNSRHAGGASSARPVVKLGIQNGLPVVRFDSVDDCLQTADFNLAQPTTIFVVAQGATGTRVMLDGLTAGNRQTIYFDGGNNRRFAGTGTLPSVTGHDANWHIQEARFNGASSQNVVDGSVVASGDAGSNTAEGITLGSFFNCAAGFWSGDIAEVLVYAAALSDADRTSVRGYLTDRWGL